MSKLSWGFLLGVLFTLAIAVWREDKRSVEPSDLVKSYEKGFQDALNAERPSERLEYVCAA